MVLGLLIFSVLAACDSETEVIEARYIACADLVSDKDMRLESLDCFTSKSKTILEGLMRESSTSRGRIDGLGRYRKLLDYDEVISPAEVHGSLALLWIKKGRRQSIVLLERSPEDGKWRIDAVELVRFWSVLNTAAKED